MNTKLHKQIVSLRERIESIEEQFIAISLDLRDEVPRLTCHYLIIHDGFGQILRGLHKLEEE